MDKKFIYQFPADVGQTIYMLMKDGSVGEARVVWYRIAGRQPYKNRVRLGYTGSDGNYYETWRKMSMFGKTMFVSRKAAEEAAETEAVNTAEEIVDEYPQVEMEA